MSENINNVSWPGWEVVELIGRGSFGAVYKIQRKVFNDVEFSALKVISIPQNSSDIDEMYNDGYDQETVTNTIQSHLESIVAEYSMMKKMSGCVNIVNCEDFNYKEKSAGIGYDISIKMELLTPLVKALPTEITEELVIKLGMDICNALKVCKEFGVIHRDIKPQNIFVSEYGEYKLGDFGIAKTVERTMGGTKIGTYKYMAPEVYNNQPYGHSVDIYSLGLVMYWLLNERRMPFMPLPPEKPKAGMEEESRHRRLSGEKLPEPLNGSDELKRIVLKACAYNSSERYHDATQMLADLVELAKIKDVGGFISSIVIREEPPETPPEAELSVKEQKEVLDEQAIPSGDTPKEVLDEEDAPSGDTQKETKDVEEAPKKKKSDKNKIIKIAAVVVVVLACVISAVTALKNKNDLLKETEKQGEAVNQGVVETMATQTSEQAETEKESSTETTLSETETTNPETTKTQEQTTTKKTLPVQVDWSVWSDKLPSYVNSNDYKIEKKTVYSSRKLEKTSSTKSKTLDGWTLDRTVESGKVGEWSNWSNNPVSQQEGREIQTKQLYRYRNLETTTGSSSTKDGWTLYNTTYAWSNYGNWSDWSVNAVSADDTRKVEKKTQYRKRSITTTTGYTDWSAWSGWSDSRQSTNDLKKEESRRVSGYYYFKCSRCGAHMHGWGITCPTWAGGCGKTTITQNDWVCMFATPTWANAGLKEFHGTGKYYTDAFGAGTYGRWFKWSDSNGGEKTQYRYSTRSTKEIKNYGSWSGWVDTVYTDSATLDAESRVVYRYCTRTSIPTYYFKRWGSWSNWTTQSVSETDTREVESVTQYRYRDEVKTTTYFFKKWSDWGPYLDGKVSESSTVDVRTKTQYRYKSK